MFKDNYFRFWLTYNYRLTTLLETGMVEEALEHILETLHGYMSRVFEDMLPEIAAVLYKQRYIKARPVQVGRWWHKDTEIDLIVREPGKHTCFIEAKWSKLTVKEAEEEIERLQEKSAKTGLTSPTNTYILVAKQITDRRTPVTKGHWKIVDLSILKSFGHGRRGKAEP